MKCDMAKDMTSMQCKPVMWVWKQSSQWSPGAEPLAGGQGCETPCRMQMETF